MKKSYVSIGIPIVFSLIGIFAHISNINPYLSIISNLIIILIIFSFTSSDKTNSCALPFMMGYIMLQGYDISSVSLIKRIFSLFIGGALVGFVYYFYNRKIIDEKYDIDIIKTTKTVLFSKDYVRFTTSVILVTFICQLLKIPNYMWINLTIFSLINPVAKEIASKKYFRIFGTIIGCILFFIVFQILVPSDKHQAIILLCGFLSMFLSSYFLKTMYYSFSALTTAILLFPVDKAINLRIFANITGVVVVILSTLLFNFIYSKFDNKKHI